MRAVLRFAWLAAGLALAGTAPIAHAQTGATGEGDQDPVFAFNRICYGQVPSVAAIRDMALRLAWRAMSDEDIAQFAPAGTVPEVLDGWDAQVGQRIYRVAISQGAPTPGLAATFPDFAGGKATTCTMVLDENHDPAVFVPNMGRLAGKPPASENVPGEGGVKTTTWAGGNADVKVFLVARANPNDEGGVLAVTVLQKGSGR